MENRGVLPILRHAFLMVGRTLKSYVLLSVTIVLSLSLLLGYLTYTDTAIYNENAELFSYRRGDVTLSDYNNEAGKLQLLLENLDRMERTGYYVYQHVWLGTLDNHFELQVDPLPAEPYEITNLNVGVYILPDHAWPQGVWSADCHRRQEIIWTNGSNPDCFSLAPDEVVLEEAAYRAFGLNSQDNSVLKLKLDDGPELSVKVVGYYRGWTYDEWVSFCTETEYPMWSIDMLVSSDFAEYARFGDPNVWKTNRYPNYGTKHVQIYSETPEQVIVLFETLGYTHNYVAISEQQDSVMEEIRLKKQNKAIIAGAMLLILGINLYSSFTNALNDRKFEIGVKRAIGASGFTVMRQFLYEAMIVMAANVLISVSLVADIAVVYKYVVEHIPNELGGYNQCILYISPYSIAVFAICAVVLTVVYSLIFSFKTTRVEIIQYLKAE